MDKYLMLCVFVSIALIVSATVIVSKSKTQNINEPSNKVLSEQKEINPEILKDAQVLDLTAKGGYYPAVINAKADKPSILRVKTSSTFDCSSALVIPKLNVSKMLQPSGTTEILIEPQKAGTEIDITCSMGMYGSVIKFN